MSKHATSTSRAKVTHQNALYRLRGTLGRVKRHPKTGKFRVLTHPRPAAVPADCHWLNPTTFNSRSDFEMAVVAAETIGYA
ncbi:protein of unknown function [Burkholderia multivorans]